jgi:hypothetical protein
MLIYIYIYCVNHEVRFEKGSVADWFKALALATRHFRGIGSNFTADNISDQRKKIICLSHKLYSYFICYGLKFVL